MFTLQGGDNITSKDRVKVDEKDLTFHYESRHKCPVCGGHDRKFELSTSHISLEKNVNFEDCVCGATIKVTTVLEVVREYKQ